MNWNTLCGSQQILYFLHLIFSNGESDFNNENLKKQTEFLKKQLVQELRNRKALEHKLDEKDNLIKKLVEDSSVRRGSVSTSILHSNSNPNSNSNSTFGSPLTLRSLSTKILNSDSKEETEYINSMIAEQSKDEKIVTLQNKLEATEKKLEEMENECKKASLISWRTMNDKVKQDIEMEVWRRKFAILQEEQAERERILSKKEEEINKLSHDLLAKNESNYKMALKLLDYQTKVSNLELQLRKFQVKRIYKFYPNSDVELILTKNPATGVLSIDIVEKGKHTQKPLKMAQLTSTSDTQNRFIITYLDGGTDSFESEMAIDIVNSINEVVGVT